MKDVRDAAAWFSSMILYQTKHVAMMTIKMKPTILKSSPASDDAHSLQELLVVVPDINQDDDGRAVIIILILPGHTDGDNMRLPLNWVFEFKNGDVVLKGGRLVVLVHHHTFHLWVVDFVRYFICLAMVIDHHNGDFYLHFLCGHHLIGPRYVVLPHLNQEGSEEPGNDFHNLITLTSKYIKTVSIVSI